MRVPTAALLSALRRTFLTRSDRVGQRQRDVIRRRTPVGRAAKKISGAQRGLESLHGTPRQPPMTADVAKQRQRIVQRETDVELPARNAVSRVHRPGEGHRTHEMRRDSKQRSPFAAGLEDERELPVLEIAQPAVHEARRPTGGTARKIVLLHERNAKY